MILLLFVCRVTKQYLSDEVSKLLDTSLKNSFQEIDQCFRLMVIISDEPSVQIAHGEHVSWLEFRSHRVDLLSISEGWALPLSYVLGAGNEVTFHDGTPFNAELPLSYVLGAGNESRADPDWFQR